MKLIFELDFLSILNLIFAGYTGSKNQVWNGKKKLKNQIREIEILKNQVQIDGGKKPLIIALLLRWVIQKSFQKKLVGSRWDFS